MSFAAFRSKPVKAEAAIVGCSDPAIQGRLKLTERPSDQGIKEVKVQLEVVGLAPGMHGVQIHETGICQPCSAAGGHFDPGPAGSVSPDGNHPFHAGDLPNLRVRNPDKKAKLKKFTTSRFTLSPGPLSLFDANGAAVHAYRIQGGTR